MRCPGKFNDSGVERIYDEVRAVQMPASIAAHAIRRIALHAERHAVAVVGAPVLN